MRSASRYGSGLRKIVQHGEDRSGCSDSNGQHNDTQKRHGRISFDLAEAVGKVEC